MFETFRNKLEHQGSSGSIQEQPGVSGNIQEHPGTSRNIREHPGTSGNIREHPGISGVNKKSLVSPSLVQKYSSGMDIISHAKWAL